MAISRNDKNLRKRILKEHWQNSFQKATFCPRVSFLNSNPQDCLIDFSLCSYRCASNGNETILWLNLVLQYCRLGSPTGILIFLETNMILYYEPYKNLLIRVGSLSSRWTSELNENSEHFHFCNPNLKIILKPNHSLVLMSVSQNLSNSFLSHLLVGKWLPTRRETTSKEKAKLFWIISKFLYSLLFCIVSST